MSKIRVSDGFYKADVETVAAALCFVDLILHFMRALKTLCQCNNCLSLCYHGNFKRPENFGDTLLYELFRFLEHILDYVYIYISDQLN